VCRGCRVPVGMYTYDLCCCECFQWECACLLAWACVHVQASHVCVCVCLSTSVSICDATVFQHMVCIILIASIRLPFQVVFVVLVLKDCVGRLYMCLCCSLAERKFNRAAGQSSLSLILYLYACEVCVCVHARP